MGNCVGVNKSEYRKSQAKKYQSLVHQKEYYLLKLIYADLGSRIIQNQLNLENFLLFFQKNGCWGDRLFKQFDVGASNLITQEQFIRGIIKIFKTTQNEKIELLFKFFSGNSLRQQGIGLSEFLKMLYNYPKQQLKQILNDQQFFNKQLRKNIIVHNNSFKGRRLDSIYVNKQLSSFNSKDTTFTVQQDYNYTSSDPVIQNKIQSQILSSLYKNRQFKSTTFKVKIGQNNLEVSTKNIHHLVKKFAISIFKGYNINIKTGKLKFQQFKDWMIKHKQLYDNYFKGFHSQIWELDRTLNKPMFCFKQMEFSSQAIVYIGPQSIRKVRISLFRSILIVCQIHNPQTPISIVCLDGLSAKRINEPDRGNGIEITHRDQVYSVKNFYLKNQQLAEQWMDYLKFYKGCSITMFYQMNEKIGVGKFSVVYNGKDNQYGEKYAIKVIQNSKLDQQARKLIAHQSSIMSIVSHPMLIVFKQSIQTKTHIYIVTQLVQGKDLFQYVKQYHPKYLCESHAAFIIKQIIIGVKYLHNLGIVHRDLKPENIMVFVSLHQIQYNRKKKEIGKVKIIDFGFSNYLQTLRCMPAEQILAGTPSYIAPQLLRMKNYITTKIDNFSIGCILYFMLSGKVAFDGYNLNETIQNTLQSRYQLNDKRWKTISNEAKDLVKKLLQNDDNDRISLEEALDHPWFAKFPSYPQANQHYQQLTDA